MIHFMQYRADYAKLAAQYSVRVVDVTNKVSIVLYDLLLWYYFSSCYI